MKSRILFIARNIPTPKQKNNKVILYIAEKLSSNYKVDFIFPKEFVPFGLHFLSKYKSLYGLKPWKWNEGIIEILTYFRLPFPNSAFKLVHLSSISKIENKNYTIIHAHFIFPDGIFAFLFAQKWNLPFVLTVRESDLVLLRKCDKKSSSWKWGGKILKSATKIFTLNKASTSFLLKNFDAESQLLPHGINSDLILQSPPKKEKSQEVKISVVGEAIKTKQIDWVINAVKEYSGEEKISLTIIGNGVELNHLKKLSAHSDNIQVMGKIPHQKVFEFLTKSDIFALPSCKESFGLVYLEAAATYNAIIGYYNTGIYGVLEEDQEIIYVNDYQNFKNQLYSLIEDKEKREQLSFNAWKKSKNLTWDKIISKYDKEYQNIISH